MGDDATTVEDYLRDEGIAPTLVKFGRLVGRGADDPLRLTIDEFNRASIGGRALDAADTWFVGLRVQYQRVCEPPGEDASLDDILAYMADIEMALTLLVRLRRAASLIARHVEGGEILVRAVEGFDTAVPDLTYLRDTQEHFDDYALGKGRHPPRQGVGRSYGYFASPPPWPHGPTVTRKDRTVDIGVAYRAACALYQAIYAVTKQEPSPPQRLVAACRELLEPIPPPGPWITMSTGGGSYVFPTPNDGPRIGPFA